MSSPTVNDILNLARSCAGDDAVAGGDQWPNSLLLPLFQQSWREYFRLIAALGMNRGYAFWYTIIPANTNQYQLAVPVSSIVKVEEASPGTAIPVSTSSFSNSTLTVNTSSPHGLGPGSYVIPISLAFSQAGNNQLWCVTTTPSPTQFTIAGSYFSTGSGGPNGSIYPVTNDFHDLISLPYIRGTPPPQGIISSYANASGVISFPPATVPRILKIHYFITGDEAPSNTSTVITEPDIQDYLSVRTAAFACAAHDATNLAQMLNARAIGDPTGNLAEIPVGGILRQRFASLIKERQSQSIYRRRYREPRTFQPAWGSLTGDIPIY